MRRRGYKSFGKVMRLNVLLVKNKMILFHVALNDNWLPYIVGIAMKNDACIQS